MSTIIFSYSPLIKIKNKIFVLIVIIKCIFLEIYDLKTNDPHGSCRDIVIFVCCARGIPNISNKLYYLALVIIIC